MTAKQKFLASPHRKDFEAMALTQAFQTACDYALLAMMEGQPEPASVQSGWDNNSRIEGAKKFIQILQNIHNPIKSPTTRSQPALNPEHGI